jgi:hypothetical protein
MVTGIITVMITAMITVVGIMTNTIASTTMTDAKVARARQMREPTANLCLRRTLQ